MARPPPCALRAHHPLPSPVVPPGAGWTSTRTANPSTRASSPRREAGPGCKTCSRRSLAWPRCEVERRRCRSLACPLPHAKPPTRWHAPAHPCATPSTHPLSTLQTPPTQKHGVSIADVASRWVLQRPTVAAVIVGARNAKHVDDHRRLFTFSLDAGGWAGGRVRASSLGGARATRRSLSRPRHATPPPLLVRTRPPPPPPPEDEASIQAVLDRGRQPTSDVYEWERGRSAW